MWSVKNSFKFLKTKIICTQFCLLWSLLHDPELFVDREPIEVVKEFKFLGITFEKKLTFIPHTRSLRTRYLTWYYKVLGQNQMGCRVLSIIMHRTKSLSDLNWTMVVLGSARKSYIQMLDTIHHQGLRLALGAFSMSSVQSLYTEANEPSLQNRHLKLTLQYASKLKANQNSSAVTAIFQH